MSAFFLTLVDVLEIHKNQIDNYGGAHGIRDQGLLESALAQPTASFGGVFSHETIIDMAGAYAYHLCCNHPFLDGNKRVALAAALVFLELNQITLDDPDEKLYGVMIAMADGKLSKTAFTDLIASLSKPTS